MCGIMMEVEKRLGAGPCFPSCKTITKYVAFLLLKKDDYEHCDAKSGNEETNRIRTVMVAK